MKLGSKGNEGPYRITDVDGAGVHYRTEGGEQVVPWKSEASWKLIDIL